MYTDETCAILDETFSWTDLDIDKALDTFNNCINEKAECMKKHITIKMGESQTNGLTGSVKWEEEMSEGF